jgi:alpha-galactosidase
LRLRTTIAKAALTPVAVFGLLLSPLLAQTTKVASTPPMGWNSWNHFRDKIDDATVRAQADAMVSSGMRDAGYI